MSSLIAIAGLLDFTDDIGMIWSRGSFAVDEMNLRALKLVNVDLFSAFGLSGTNPNDGAQFAAWQPFLQGVYQQSGGGINALGLPLGGSFGSVSAQGGSFGNGLGLFNRASLFGQGLFYALQGINRQISVYGPAVAAGLVDFLTYAAFANHATPFSLLYDSNFAILFWYAFNQQKQLDAAAIPGGTGNILYPPVFAPSGILLADYSITGSGTGTLTNNAATNWPSGNGYSSPAPTNTGPGNDRGAYNAGTSYSIGDAVLSNGVYYVSLVNSNLGNTPSTSPSDWAVSTFGNNLFLGNLPMAQWFAPLKSTQCRITTNINGTATLTITAPAFDNAGTSHASRTFTVVIDNQTVGTITQLTPNVGGDRMNGPPITITVAGTATAGAVVIESGTPERTII